MRISTDKIFERYQVNEEITIPSYVRVSNIPKYSKYFDDGTDKPIDVLFAFNHSGLLVPDEFSKFYTKDISIIEDTVIQNHDVGTRYILNHLLRNINSSNYRYGILFDEVSRVVADSNRLTREEQVVEKAYRGESIWISKDIDRTIIGSSTIDDTYTYLQSFIKIQKKLKFILYMHSMDQFNGGRPSGNHELGNDKKEERPIAMIFNKYKFDHNSYGIYGPDKSVDFNLLPDRSIKKIKNCFIENTQLGKSEDIKIDYPYISPRQMCGFVSQFTKIPQLVLDVRKDLFIKNADNISRSVEDIPLIFLG